MSNARRAGIIGLLVFGVCTLLLVVSTDVVALRQYYRCAFVVEGFQPGRTQYTCVWGFFLFYMRQRYFVEEL